METLKNIFETSMHNKIVQLVVIMIVIDTIFGCIRAVKQKKWNSSVGINGALRKIGMMISLASLIFIDYIISFNLIGFIPDEIRTYLGDKIGLTEFFSLLYIAYEAVSILKNMYLSGLPVKFIWVKVYNFLQKYTKELPDDEGELKKKEEQKDDKNCA